MMLQMQGGCKHHSTCSLSGQDQFVNPFQKKELFGYQNQMCIMLTGACIRTYAQLAVHLPYQCPQMQFEV